MSVILARAVSRFAWAVFIGLATGVSFGSLGAGTVAGLAALLVIDRVQLLLAWSYRTKTDGRTRKPRH